MRVRAESQACMIAANFCASEGACCASAEREPAGATVGFCSAHFRTSERNSAMNGSINIAHVSETAVFLLLLLCFNVVCFVLMLCALF